MQLINSYLWFQFSDQSSGSLTMLFYLDYEYIIPHCINSSPYTAVLVLLVWFTYKWSFLSARSVGAISISQTCSNCTLLQVDVHRASALCAYKGTFFSHGTSIYETDLSFLKPVLCLRWDPWNSSHTSLLLKKVYPPLLHSVFKVHGVPSLPINP